MRRRRVYEAAPARTRHMHSTKDSGGGHGFQLGSADGDGSTARTILHDMGLLHRTPSASPQVNFIYIVGDKASRECIVIDPCWDVDGIKRVVQENKYKLVGAIATRALPP